MRLVSLVLDLDRVNRCLDLCRYILFKVRLNPMRALPMDIILLILDQLDAQSQENFCLAVGGELDERLTFLQFLKDVIGSCRDCGERVLFTYAPSYLFPCHVHADWSPFSQEPMPEPIAKVYWSFFRHKPIVTINEEVAKEKAEAAVRERRYQVRMTAHMHRIHVDPDEEELMVSFVPTPCHMTATNFCWEKTNDRPLQTWPEIQEGGRRSGA